METAEATSGPVDLEAIKQKANDPSYPIIRLSADANAYLTEIPGAKIEDLMEALNKSETWVRHLLKFVGLPDAVRRKAELEKTGYRELQILVYPNQLAADRATAGRDAAQGTTETTTGTTEVSTETTALTTAPSDQTTPTTEAPKTQNTQPSRTTAPTTPKSGDFLLIRDSVNGVIQTAMFWVKEEPVLGEIVERWLIAIRDIGVPRVILWVIGLALLLDGSVHVATDAGRWINRGMAGMFGPARIALAAPRVTGSRLVAGNRMELRWAPGPKGTRYLVYWKPDQLDAVQALTHSPMESRGAIVNISYSAEYAKGRLTVTAVSPDDSESPHSEPIAYQLTQVNQANIVEPIEPAGRPVQPETAAAPPAEGEARQGRPASSGASRPRAAAAPPTTAVAAPVAAASQKPPAPTNLHVLVKTPDRIEVRWRPVGPGLRYNLYSSEKPDMIKLRLESQNPTNATSIIWIPETGKDRYWITVTALDEQGRESYYADAVEVIRHPERNTLAEEEAAGVLRRLLPW